MSRDPSHLSGLIVRLELAVCGREVTIPAHLILDFAGQPRTDDVGMASLIHNFAPRIV